jgi:hypothetical protein
MRIYGPNGAVSVGTSGSSSARRSSGAGFSLPDAEESRPSTSTAPARHIGGIDALMALQGVEDPTERRRRAVKKGFRALDALDELKIGLLSGTLNPATLLRLKAAAGDMKTESGDSRLDQVLAEIDLRVEVELAKAGLK